MNDLKRIVCSALIIVMAVLLVGCGAGGSREGRASETGASETPTDAEYEENGSYDSIGENGMTPYDTDMTGCRGGYFFIPIDGSIYRYGVASRPGQSLTKTELICEFTEHEITEDYEHSVYRLAEFPDNTVLCDVCRTKEGTVLDEGPIEYRPALGVEDCELDRAIKDGFVIMEDGSVTHGREQWLEFYDETVSGQPVSIRICNYYTLARQNMSAELYEAVRYDYPQIFLKELKFDGTRYTVRQLKRSEDGSLEYVRTEDGVSEADWKYLLHLTGEPSSANALFSAFDRYVLINDDTVTWEDIERGLVSSHFGDYIPFEEVFCEYTWK